MSSQTIGDQRSPAAPEPEPTQADAPAHEGTQASPRIPAQARAPQAEAAAAARIAATAETPAPARVSVLAAAAPDEPAQGPAPRRIASVCAWAAVLGLADLVLVICGLVTILGGTAPGWYEPVLIVLGLGGIALAATAFVTIQFRIVPWIFMALSSGVVLVSLIMTGSVA